MAAVKEQASIATKASEEFDGRCAVIVREAMRDAGSAEKAVELLAAKLINAHHAFQCAVAQLRASEAQTEATKAEVGRIVAELKDDNKAFVASMRALVIDTQTQVEQLIELVQGRDATIAQLIGLVQERDATIARLSKPT